MVSSAKKGLLYKLKGFQRRTKHSLFKVVQRARMLLARDRGRVGRSRLKTGRVHAFLHA
jgi:hypothetical protein